MKLGKVLCLILALLLALSACGKQPQTQDPIQGSEVSVQEYRVLFIGNSYTFYNSMPTAYFQAMGASCGYELSITEITKGAYTLEKFTDTADLYGMRVHSALSQKDVFDYVILQEQSLRPAIDPEAFYAAVRVLAEKIREAGAKPVLYATWGRKAGNADLEKYGLTHETMTEKLAQAYTAIGEELDIPVMHAGLAFHEVYTTSSVELYDPDKTHPSATGSYLAALMLFCGMFGEDPEELPFRPELPAGEDAILRAAAKKILAENS